MFDHPTEYCESLSGFTHEPINALTSLLFFLAAFVSWRHIHSGPKPSLIIRSLPFTIAVTGAASAFWHAFSTQFGAWLDVIAVIVVVSLVSIALIRHLISNALPQTIIFFSLLIAGLWLSQLPDLNGSSAYLLLLLFLGVTLVLLVLKKEIPAPITIVTLGTLSLSLTARIIDPLVCTNLPIGTHFIWHLCNAVAMVLLVRILYTLETRKR